MRLVSTQKCPRCDVKKISVFNPDQKKKITRTSRRPTPHRARPSGKPPLPPALGSRTRTGKPAKHRPEPFHDGGVGGPPPPGPGSSGPQARPAPPPSLKKAGQMRPGPARWGADFDGGWRTSSRANCARKMDVAPGIAHMPAKGFRAVGSFGGFNVRVARHPDPVWEKSHSAWWRPRAGARALTPPGPPPFPLATG